MQNQQTNKDLPAQPVQFMDKFSNQMIILAGMTKQEVAALEILKAMIISDDNIVDNPEDRKFAIQAAFQVAEDFCSFLEK